MSNELKSKAVDWFVRLRGSSVSQRERNAFDKWLAEDPAHRVAQSAVEDEWRHLDDLSGWAAAELQRLEPAQGKRKHIGLKYWWFGIAAASVAALALLGLQLMFKPAGQNEHIVTVKGEQRRVVLADGSRMHLNSASAVDIRFSGEEREVTLIEGEGLFDVAHDPVRPFVVQVPGRKVVAVGTRFNVHFADGELSVTVLEGNVMIIPDKESSAQGTEHELLLGPDQQARVDAAGTMGAVRAVDADRLTSWDKGLLIFDKTPLREVSAEISRYVGGEIKIAAGVPDYPVTGTIKIRDKETMLRILSEVAPVTPVRTTSTVTTLMQLPTGMAREDRK